MKQGTYETIEAAKQAAELDDTYTGNVRIVYQIGDKFDYFKHPENRYLFSYVPDGGKIVSIKDNDAAWSDKGRSAIDDALASGSKDPALFDLASSLDLLSGK